MDSVTKNYLDSPSKKPLDSVTKNSIDITRLGCYLLHLLCLNWLLYATALVRQEHGKELAGSLL